MDENEHEVENGEVEEELDEMMVIEINFGKDKSDEVMVHFGDDPIELAKVVYSRFLSLKFE
jgi:hypothetical protein